MALCKYNASYENDENEIERDRTRRLYLFYLSFIFLLSFYLPFLLESKQMQKNKANNNKIKYNSSCMAMLFEGFLRSFRLVTLI